MRLIDADALFNDLKESANDAREWKEETQDEEIKIRAEQARVTFIECALRVKHAPTIEAELVRHGRWDEIQCFSEHGIPMASYECTNCGNDIERQWGIVPAYCEFCGAKMDGGADNA